MEKFNVGDIVYYIEPDMTRDFDFIEWLACESAAQEYYAYKVINDTANGQLPDYIIEAIQGGSPGILVSGDYLFTTWAECRRAFLACAHYKTNELNKRIKEALKNVKSD